jgi:arylsulfatase A-like enzyme
MATSVRSRSSGLWLLFYLLTCSATLTPTYKNVFMIVVDDMRPQTKAYGADYMHTPNLDKLASEGAMFENAYVQQSICSPTRNSFLSGRLPDKTKTW